MEINKKCICGAMWKARGIPQRVAEKFMMEWDFAHSTCGIRSTLLNFQTREKEYFESLKEVKK